MPANSEHLVEAVAIKHTTGVGQSSGSSTTPGSNLITTPPVTVVYGAIVLRCAWWVNLSTGTTHETSWASAATEVVDISASTYGAAMSVPTQSFESSGSSGSVSATATGSGPRAWMTIALNP